MTTETILTNQEISDAWGSTVEEWGLTLQQFEQVLQFSRAIEQAVLQSPEVQAWKRDAERLDWLESCEDSHGFCHAGYGDYIYYAHQVTGMPSVREVIDAAMETQ